MKLLCITVYVHSLHISHHFFYGDTFDSTQFAVDTTHFHNSTSILHSVLSFTPSLSLFIKLYNLIKVSIYDVHSYGSFTLNTAGNFAVWQMSIFERKQTEIRAPRSPSVYKSRRTNFSTATKRRQQTCPFMAAMNTNTSST